MTPEAQRIAIAEACGYERYLGALVKKGTQDQNVPDYLSDLNAMNEAEKVLTFEQWPDYIDHLIDDSPAPKSKASHRGYEVCHATAAQRAEAFLRTLNLWKDS